MEECISMLRPLSALICTTSHGKGSGEEQNQVVISLVFVYSAEIAAQTVSKDRLEVRCLNSHVNRKQGSHMSAEEAKHF